MHKKGWLKVTALIFVIFGLYALSGARVIRRLPLLRLGLLLIGLLYPLVGINFIFQVLAMLQILSRELHALTPDEIILLRMAALLDEYELVHD